MIVGKLNSFYIVNKIKEHLYMKNHLLNFISKLPSNKFETISHTDWNLPKNINGEYFKFFIETITPYMNQIMEKIHCSNWQIHDYWFQQYNEGDEHKWHIHGNANYTNVYFLEMPSSSMTTEIYDIIDKKTINLNLNEFSKIVLASKLPCTKLNCLIESFFKLYIFIISR